MIKPYFETSLGKLYNCDCLEFMKELPDNSIDMLLSDPPYGIDFCSPRTNRKDRLENDKLDDWKNMLPDMLSQFKRIITPSGCCCCCCCGGGKTPVAAIFTLEAIKYFNLIQTLVWKKFIGLGWRYRPSYENILILSKDIKNYSFYDETKSCSNVIEGINQDIPIYNGKKVGCSDEHPTQKPIALWIHLLKIHSKENDLILDPFIGGGSLAVACEKLGRRWLGCEINSRYCSIAAKRIKNESDQIKLF